MKKNYIYNIEKITYINNLVKKRKLLYNRHINSYQEKVDNYKIKEPKTVDLLQDRILEELKNNFNFLPVDFIIETLTKLGSYLNVIYDDHGNFIISSDVSFGSVDNINFSDVQIINGEWKPNIRLALNYYLFKDNEE
jgi:hypothetical protein